MAAGGRLGDLVHDQLIKGRIVPDVVSQLPDQVLNIVVTYRETEVQNGVALRLAATRIKPHVELRGKGFGGASDKWALLMVDPDAPSADAPEFRNVLHWMVVNIPGSTHPSQESGRLGRR